MGYIERNRGQVLVFFALALVVLAALESTSATCAARDTNCSDVLTRAHWAVHLIIKNCSGGAPGTLNFSIRAL